VRLGDAVESWLHGATVDPYPLYAAMRAYGPLLIVRDGLAVASGYAAADEVLRDGRMRVPAGDVGGRTDGSAGASIARSVLQANPPDHARVRRLVAGAFTARRVAGLRATVTAQAEALAGYVRALGRSGLVDFMAEFAYPLPIRIVGALLGVPAADQAFLREQAEALTTVLEPVLTPAEVAVADRASAELDAYLGELIGRRRREPADDLTTELVRVHTADPAALTAAELLANLKLLLVAGFETTTNLLGNGLVTLLNEPVVAARLRADGGPAEGVVNEVLRYDPPVQFTTRWSPDPVTIAGVPLPPYTEIVVLLGAANRDPDRFVDPDRFDPDRTGNQPLSFGAGPHFCLGAALARLEAEVAFPLLLRRFPELALAGPPRRRHRVALRGYAALPVHV
jgi:cytochrome P450